MTETNVSSNGNTKTSQRGDNQTEPGDGVTLFHPVRLTEDPEDISEKEGTLQELMRSINEESSKLSAFLATENKLVIENCTCLAQILKKLHISFNIPPRDLPLEKNPGKVILNENGHLELFCEKGEVNSAFLAEYTPGIVMAVLWVVLPELLKVIELQRKKVSKRVSLYETMKKELRNLVDAIVGTGEEKKPQTKRETNTTDEIPRTDKQR